MDNADLKIINYNINDIVFAEYNPRQLSDEQYKHLKDSITRFGIVDPLIINTNKERKNILVGGHQRLKVAMDMKIKVIPCVEVDLVYDKEKELNIRLNKNVGEWDWDLLANNFENDELVNWGFNESQLVGFSNIDYSILDDEEGIDDVMEEMLDGTRKAIQIEFTLEDYEEAYSLINKLRKDGEYVGGLILAALKK